MFGTGGRKESQSMDLPPIFLHTWRLNYAKRSIPNTPRKNVSFTTFSVLSYSGVNVLASYLRVNFGTWDQRNIMKKEL